MIEVGDQKEGEAAAGGDRLIVEGDASTCDTPCIDGEPKTAPPRFCAARARARWATGAGS